MGMSIAELEANRARRNASMLFAPEVHIDPGELKPLPKGPPVNLMEKYRPTHLGDVVGQESCVKILRAYLKNPYPVAFLFGGESGVGKTSTALVLANELGCDASKAELGGVWQIPSGEQSVSAVRELAGRLHFVPFYGSGWKVVIINEADYMAPQAEAVWLDVLENLPPRTVIVFTTNNANKLSARFIDRCYGIPFASKADALGDAVQTLIRRVWEGETGRTSGYPSEVPFAVQNGRVSFRRVVQGIGRMIDAA